MFKRIAAVIACSLSMMPSAFAQTSPPPEEPNFASRCAFSHRAADDPIVKPGQPGASHSHDFFGNTTTNAFSTYESLLEGDTTCRRDEDTAAYWIPTLLRNRRPVTPAGATFYYRDGGHEPGTIQAFPAGLKVVAGDASARSAQGRMVTAWSCGQGSPQTERAPSSCPRGSELHLHIRFPDCWDGTNTDSADHRSHMAYGARAGCPSTHPVSVPKLTFNVRYPLRSGRGLAFSSGTIWSAHADFFNAWDQAALQALVDRCLNGQVHCGAAG